MNERKEYLIDLGYDVNGQMSSLTSDGFSKKELKKLNGRRPAEIDGIWIYIEGTVSTGNAGNRARYIAEKFAEVLSRKGIRIGKNWDDDVTSWYMWESAQGAIE